MNTRTELQARLEEIKKTAAELPGPEADVAQLHYALTRLSNWTTRTMNFITIMDNPTEPKEKGGFIY